MKLGNNHIPMCLIPLEKIFDQNYVAMKPSIHVEVQEVEEINIGVEDSP